MNCTIPKLSRWLAPLIAAPIHSHPTPIEHTHRIANRRCQPSPVPFPARNTSLGSAASQLAPRQRPTDGTSGADARPLVAQRATTFAAYQCESWAFPTRYRLKECPDAHARTWIRRGGVCMEPWKAPGRSGRSPICAGKGGSSAHRAPLSAVISAGSWRPLLIAECMRIGVSQVRCEQRVGGGGRT